jgi:NADH-quinone oxidoreductase subunit L
MTFVLLALAMPVASCVLALLIPRRFMWLTPIVSTLLMLVSVIASGVLYAKGWSHEVKTSVEWFSLGDTTLSLSIVADSLALPMLSMVLLISFLVHLYSVGFMADDHHAGRYFAFLGFFTFSMLALIVSGNMLMLFFFWELVGFSSYLLIGHWRDRPAAGAAATKAFIFNRVGDALFLVGLMIIWKNTGTLDIQTIATSDIDHTWLMWAGICIFCGVIGKSAQFPLLTWLPDAMEGPTPVSALIHAATMVAAGVYLLLRVPFLITPTTSVVIAIVGCITVLYGGWMALQQFDLKKILAYSTISQLGLMMLAIGAGSEEGAFVHLISHAFFKACLFLAAGSIIHSLYHVAKQNEFSPQDIRNMGGWYSITPRLFIATSLAVAAICGLPLMSGFISKEMILVPMFRRALETSDIFAWIYVVVFFISSMLTILYSYRMYVSIFFGPNATPHANLTPIPPVMQWPVSLLAVLSLWVFYSWNIAGPGEWLSHFRSDHALSSTQWHVNFPLSGLIAWISFGWTLLSLGLAWSLFTGNKIRIRERQDSLDNLYNTTVVTSSLRLSNSTAKFDKQVIDGAVHVFVYTQVTFAKVARLIDVYAIDGTVSFVAWAARAMGNLLRNTSGGRIQSYLVWSAIALIIFIFWLLK